MNDETKSMARRMFMNFPDEINGKPKLQIFTNGGEQDDAVNYFVLYGDDEASYVAYIVCTDNTVRKEKYDIFVSDVMGKAQFAE